MWWAAMVLGVLALSVVTACGDDDDGDGTSAAAKADTTETTAKAATGPPITIAFVADSYPAFDGYGFMESGVNGAAKYINEKLGGIGGRPIEIFGCNPKGDPAASTTCANNALEKKPLAMIGAANNWDTNGLALFEKAGIPSFNDVISEAGSNTPANIALQPGGNGMYLGQAKYACDLGVKRVTVLEYDIPGQISAFAPADKVMRACGIDIETIKINPQSADLGAATNQAVQTDPELLLLEMADPGVRLALQTIQQAGFDQAKVLTPFSVLDSKVLDAVGEAAENILISTTFEPYTNTENKDVAEYVEAMEAADEFHGSTYAAWGFANLMTIRAGAEKIGFDKVTPESLMDFFNSEEAIGLPVYMAKPLAKSPEGYSSVHQPQTKVVQWKGGSFVDPPGGGWIDGFSAR